MCGTPDLQEDFFILGSITTGTRRLGTMTLNDPPGVDGSPLLDQPGDRALNHVDERRWIDS
jgi:hypothetical protein